MFNMVLNGLQCPQMVLKGLKNKFNWMARITRFNLVLVWSKMVQILTKNHPKRSSITRSSGHFFCGHNIFFFSSGFKIFYS